MVAGIVKQINSGDYRNPAVEQKLLKLSQELTGLGGKKEYKYLRTDLKQLVDAIVTELSADARIQQLYDLWYQMREANYRIYTDELPGRVPLVDNPEFRTFKNAVIQEAMHIVKNKTVAEEPEASASVSKPTPVKNAQPQPSQSSTPNSLGSVAAVGAIRLLHYLSRIFQDQADDMWQDEFTDADKKLRQKTEQKRQAHGLKHG